MDCRTAIKLPADTSDSYSARSSSESVPSLDFAANRSIRFCTASDARTPINCRAPSVVRQRPTGSSNSCRAAVCVVMLKVYHGDSAEGQLLPRAGDGESRDSERNALLSLVATPLFSVGDAVIKPRIRHHISTSALASRVQTARFTRPARLEQQILSSIIRDSHPVGDSQQNHETGTI